MTHNIEERSPTPLSKKPKDHDEETSLENSFLCGAYASLLRPSENNFFFDGPAWARRIEMGLIGFPVGELEVKSVHALVIAAFIFKTFSHVTDDRRALLARLVKHIPFLHDKLKDFKKSSNPSQPYVAVHANLDVDPHNAFVLKVGTRQYREVKGPGALKPALCIDGMIPGTFLSDGSDASSVLISGKGKFNILKEAMNLTGKCQSPHHTGKASKAMKLGDHIYWPMCETCWRMYCSGKSVCKPGYAERVLVTDVLANKYLGDMKELISHMSILVTLGLIALQGEFKRDIPSGIGMKNIRALGVLAITHPYLLKIPKTYSVQRLLDYNNPDKAMNPIYRTFYEHLFFVPLTDNSLPGIVTKCVQNGFVPFTGGKRSKPPRWAASPGFPNIQKPFIIANFHEPNPVMYTTSFARFCALLLKSEESCGLTVEVVVTTDDEDKLATTMTGSQLAERELAYGCTKACNAAYEFPTFKPNSLRTATLKARSADSLEQQCKAPYCRNSKHNGQYCRYHGKPLTITAVVANSGATTDAYVIAVYDRALQRAEDTAHNRAKIIANREKWHCRCVSPQERDLAEKKIYNFEAKKRPKRIKLVFIGCPLSEPRNHIPAAINARRAKSVEGTAKKPMLLPGPSNVAFLLMMSYGKNPSIPYVKIKYSSQYHPDNMPQYPREDVLAYGPDAVTVKTLQNNDFHDISAATLFMSLQKADSEMPPM